MPDTIIEFVLGKFLLSINISCIRDISEPVSTKNMTSLRPGIFSLILGALTYVPPGPWYTFR